MNKVKNQLKLKLNRIEKELDEKKWELKIEASLENVRNKAMRMKKPQDMLDVCKTISVQLESLGIKDIRNVQTAIFYKQRGTYMNYEFYAKHDKTIITETVFTNHKVHNEFATQMLKGKGGVFITHIRGDEVKDWIEYQKTTNVFIDKYLETASSLNYYWFSLGPVALGISTYIPLGEEEINLFKRFLKVFELAYRRYLDIETAEAQAREAQIQLALERIRARTMAMHRSDELAETSTLIFEQFQLLGIVPQRCGFVIQKDDESVEIWGAIKNDKTYKSYRLGTIPSKAHKIFTLGMDEWRKGSLDFSYTLKGNALKDYHTAISVSTNIPEDIVAKIIEKNEVEYHYNAFFKHGSITTIFHQPPEEADRSVIRRFAKILEQTYTRFLDLQKAEEQAREAQIEAALERVRSRSMAMHHPSELQDVINTVHQQFKILNVAITGGAFIAINEENINEINCWGAGGTADYVERVHIPIFDRPIYTGLIKCINNGTGFYTEEYPYEEKIEFFNHLFNHPPYTDATPQRKKEVLSRQGGYTRSSFVSKYTSVFIINHHGRKFSDADNEILKRFGKVFEQSYTRFLDLQKAEAQARESQIELSLERVRASAMAMHNSNDVADATAVMFTELEKLGIETIRCGIDIMDKSKVFEVWASTSTEEGKVVQIVGKLDSRIHPHLQRVQEAWERGDKFISSILEGQELEKYYKKLSAAPDYHVPITRAQSNKQYNYDFFFNEGGLFAYRLKPFTEEEILILKRFTNVFGLTFRRYLDLKKAEEQAREAKIEAALESVRAKTMAMHSSNDLSDTMGVLFKELPKLGISSLRCGVVLLSKISTQGVFYAAATTSESDSFTIIGSGDMMKHPVFMKQYENWLKNQNYFVTLSGEDLQSYYKEIFARLQKTYNPREHKLQTEHGYYFSFSEGMFYSWSEEPFIDESINILNRFKAIIDLTFRRYLDLQKAEAQAREAQIETALERVRSKTLAMHSSEELADAAAVVFQQLIHLDIEPNRIYIAIIKDEIGNAEFWITDEDGSKVSSGFETNLNDNNSFKKMLEGWKGYKKSITIEMQGEELREYFKHLSSLNVPFKGGLSQKRRLQYIAYFSKGFIGVASPDETKPETLQLLERFAAVFNLTYTRFNDLLQAEAQNRIIRAENDRKTKELEEARQLQLSLLPRALPQLPKFDIAVYMKTATEVGGDYYDFNVQEDGVLNIGIGDATGHGLQAGTMITLMKGFFTSDAARFSPQKFLEHCNGMIRDIKLGRILLSFTHLRFENSRLLISSAGMPPIYYHHKRNNRTEEIIIQGLPLGAMRDASYKLVEKHLDRGDTILMLTDGLPEQMNSQNVIFDYSRVLKYFNEIAEDTSDHIISKLVKKSDEWMNGIPQCDDITFVVIRVL